MTYSLRASALDYGTGSSVSITIPSTVQAGDLMVLAISGNGNASAPSGWALQVSNSSWNNTTGYKGMVATRIAIGSDAGSTVTVSTTASISAIGVFATQGTAVYSGLNAAVFSISNSTASFGSSFSTSPGDLILMFGDAFVTGSTFNFTSTNGTVTVDGRDTTHTGASSAVGHIGAASGASTQYTHTYSPTSSQGFLAFSLLVNDYKLSAKAGGAATITLPIRGVTATVTGLAPTAGAGAGTSPAPQVVGTSPARVNMAADAPSFSFDGGAITIAGQTAEITGDPHDGILTVAGGLQGDNFNYPFVTGGSGATLTIATTSYTVETDEPAPIWPVGVFAGDPGTALLHTSWTRYTPTQNGALTITGSIGAAGPYEIELFEGNALDNLTLAGEVTNGQFNPDTGAEIPPTITSVVSANTPIYIRVWPTSTATTSIIVTLTLTFTADANQQGTLSLTVNTPTFSTSPGVVRADVIGGTPGGTLVFDLIGTTATYANPPGVGLGNAVATYATDTSGNLYGASIALPTVSAGTYTLRVVDSSTGLTDSTTIQVEADPIVPPGTIAPDDPIGPVSHGGTVKYWVFKDPAPSGLATYTFAINPTTMTGPHAPRNVTIEHTVAPDGHDMIWEGARRANEWRFQGTVLAQSDYDGIVAFAELVQRFWIVDHRDRAWVGSIESIGWTKKKAPYNDWAWDYDITALIYDGPTSI